MANAGANVAAPPRARVAGTKLWDDPKPVAAFVHTDVWVSIGQSDDAWMRRVPLLTRYRVTSDVLTGTSRPDVTFMHCLPAVHDTSTELGRRVQARFGLDGAEVTDEVSLPPPRRSPSARPRTGCTPSRRCSSRPWPDESRRLLCGR
jgi:ornithine carbamoyltransferase